MSARDRLVRRERTRERNVGERDHLAGEVSREKLADIVEKLLDLLYGGLLVQTFLHIVEKGVTDQTQLALPHRYCLALDFTT